MTWPKLDRLWTSSCLSLMNKFSLMSKAHTLTHAAVPSITVTQPHNQITTENTITHESLLRRARVACVVCVACVACVCGCVTSWLWLHDCVTLWCVLQLTYLRFGCAIKYLRFSTCLIAWSREWIFGYLNFGENWAVRLWIVISFMLHKCTIVLAVKMWRHSWFPYLLWIVQFYACRLINKFCFVLVNVMWNVLSVWINLWLFI